MTVFLAPPLSLPRASRVPWTSRVPRAPRAARASRASRASWWRTLFSSLPPAPPGPPPGPAAPPARSRYRLLGGGGEQPDTPRLTVTDLYHSHRLAMVRLAILLVDDQQSAEDVVQDAFIALYKRHGDRMDDVDNALGYLRTSVVNTARSVLRRRKTARDYVPPHESDAASAEDHVLLSDEHRRVFDALKKLTTRQREVLVLRYWSDLSEARIAETLGLSRGAVKSTASRALDALERVMKAQEQA